MFRLLQQRKLPGELQKICFQHFKGCVISGLPRHDDDVKSAFQAGLVQAIDLSQPASGAVSHHGAAQFDRNGDTQMVHRLVPAFHHIYHHGLPRGGFPSVIQCPEQVVFLDGKGFVHAFHPMLKFKTAITAVLMGFKNKLRLGAQLGAASCATAGQDFATVAGAHALTEAVLLLALTLFGLIGTDHVSHLLIEAIIDTGTGSSFQARAAADNAPCIIRDKNANCQPFFLFFLGFFRIFGESPVPIPNKL